LAECTGFGKLYFSNFYVNLVYDKLGLNSGEFTIVTAKLKSTVSAK